MASTADLLQLKSALGDKLAQLFPAFLHPYIPKEDRNAFVDMGYTNLQKAVDTKGLTVDPVAVALNAFRPFFPDVTFAYTNTDCIVSPQLRFSIGGLPAYITLPRTPDDIAHGLKHARLLQTNHLPLLKEVHTQLSLQLNTTQLTLLVGGGFQIQAFYGLNYGRYVALLYLPCEDAYSASGKLLAKHSKFSFSLACQSKEYNTAVTSVSYPKLSTSTTTYAHS